MHSKFAGTTLVGLLAINFCAEIYIWELNRSIYNIFSGTRIFCRPAGDVMNFFHDDATCEYAATLLVTFIKNIL